MKELSLFRVKKGKLDGGIIWGSTVNRAGFLPVNVATITAFGSNMAGYVVLMLLILKCCSLR